ARRNVFEPRLPRCSPTARKRNAERGSNVVEVSGFPIVRPSTDGSKRFGRSPFVPSTFPKPGPSEPVITVNGIPVLLSQTAEKDQRPKTDGTGRPFAESAGVAYRKQISAECD